MADGTTNDIIQFLLGNLEGEELKRKMGQLTESQLNSLHAQLGPKLDGIRDTINQKMDLTGIVAGKFDILSQEAMQGMERMKSLFGEGSELGNLMINIDVEDSSVGSVVETIATTLADKTFLVNIGIAGGADVLLERIKQKTSSINRSQDRMLDLTRTAASAVAGVQNPFAEGSAATTYADEEKAISNFRTSVIDTMFEIGVSKKEAQEALKSLVQQGIIDEDLEKLGGEVDSTGRKLSGLSNIITLSKGAGVSLADITDMLALRTKSLGSEADSVAESFDRMARIQAGTKLTIPELNRAIEQSVQQMKYWGDTTRGTQVLFKGFVDSLGEGKEAIALELGQDLVSRIGRIGNNLGTSAFLGMQAGMGGGGPIEAGLAVQEAIATGEGLPELVESIRDQITERTGGEILTRGEAVESGRGREYVMQQQMLQTFLGAMDEDKAALYAQMLKKADFDKLADTLRVDKGQEGAFFAMGQRTISAKTGPYGAQMNRLEALVEVTKGNAADSLVNFTDKLTTALSKGKDPLDNYRKAIEGITAAAEGEGFKKSIESFKKLFRLDISEDNPARSTDIFQRAGKDISEVQDKGTLAASTNAKLAQASRLRESVGIKSNLEQARAPDVVAGVGAGTNEQQKRVTDYVGSIMAPTNESMKNFTSLVSDIGVSVNASAALIKNGIDVLNNAEIKDKAIDVDINIPESVVIPVKLVAAADGGVSIAEAVGEINLSLEKKIADLEDRVGRVNE